MTTLYCLMMLAVIIVQENIGENDSIVSLLAWIGACFNLEYTLFKGFEPCVSGFRVMCPNIVYLKDIFFLLGLLNIACATVIVCALLTRALGILPELFGHGPDALKLASLMGFFVTPAIYLLTCATIDRVKLDKLRDKRKGTHGPILALIYILVCTVWLACTVCVELACSARDAAKRIALRVDEAYLLSGLDFTPKLPPGASVLAKRWISEDILDAFGLSDEETHMSLNSNDLDK